MTPDQIRQRRQRIIRGGDFLDWMCRNEWIYGAGLFVAGLILLLIARTR